MDEEYVGRKAPAALILAALAAVIVGAMYLLNVFSFMSKTVEEQDMVGTIVSTFFVILYFGMFTRLLVSVFGLPSGSRKSWRSTVRMSVSYIVLTLISYQGFDFVSRDLVFDGFTIPAWILSLVMLLVIVYMFKRDVREHFTPSYAEPVGIQLWLLYAFYWDPFRGSRFRV